VHKLVAKTLLFLARKIIYANLAEMEKHFYKNNLHHNFVQFLA
jgi:hypothetical protein